MNTEPLIFHGEWWVPALADPKTRSICFNPKQAMGLEQRLTGSLTYYGDRYSMLEIYHVPSHFQAQFYYQNSVMWGCDANGNVFTLFDVKMIERPFGEMTCSKFTARLILRGKQILSMDEPWFNSSRVSFQYLRNWAFQNSIVFRKSGAFYHADFPADVEKLLETKVDDTIKWKLGQGASIHTNVYDLNVSQTSVLEIESTEPLSLGAYLKQIEEFAQFLSIAECGQQNPLEIKIKGKEDKRYCELLFKREESIPPGIDPLINFRALKEKIPAMLKCWHENYDRIAPISSYLIASLKDKDRFDAPDFLIIAQALDGYHKRFVNKKEENDCRKYEVQIRKLLDQFQDVTAIQKCNIDPVVLKDSRHKYSHLYPDEEHTQAVEGEDLYWLTEKCKILLICCILNMLGLTNDEINHCCESSYVLSILNYLPETDFPTTK